MDRRLEFKNKNAPTLREFVSQVCFKYNKKNCKTYAILYTIFCYFEIKTRSFSIKEFHVFDFSNLTIN